MPRWDACATSASAQALTQAVQQPGLSASASCSAATALGLGAAALSPTVAALKLDAEQLEQVRLSCLHNARQPVCT